MPKDKWLAYNELAWTDLILTSPGDFDVEAGNYIELIKARSRIAVRTLLHLGCGAGGHDSVFKNHFQVTGVDISAGMLEIARKANPTVTYRLGDMRTADLKTLFDAVIIPDSIDYMVTLPELRSALATACRHLRPGGALLITAKVREEFRENNFCYAGVKDGVAVTLFENNHVSERNPSRYDATLVYLIRRGGRLSIRSERHRLGLFGLSEWLALLGQAGLEAGSERLDGIYEPFLMGEGKYPMRIFVGVKPA